MASRKRELGISFDSGMSVGLDLALTFGLGRAGGAGWKESDINRRVAKPVA